MTIGAIDSDRKREVQPHGQPRFNRHLHQTLVGFEHALDRGWLSGRPSIERLGHVTAAAVDAWHRMHRYVEASGAPRPSGPAHHVDAPAQTFWKMLDVSEPDITMACHFLAELGGRHGVDVPSGIHEWMANRKAESERSKPDRIRWFSNSYCFSGALREMSNVASTLDTPSYFLSAEAAEAAMATSARSGEDLDTAAVRAGGVVVWLSESVRISADFLQSNDAVARKLRAGIGQNASAGLWLDSVAYAQPEGKADAVVELMVRPQQRLGEAADNSSVYRVAVDLNGGSTLVAPLLNLVNSVALEPLSADGRSGIGL